MGFSIGAYVYTTNRRLDAIGAAHRALAGEVERLKKTFEGKNK